MDFTAQNSARVNILVFRRSVHLLLTRNKPNVELKVELIHVFKFPCGLCYCGVCAFVVCSLCVCVFVFPHLLTPLLSSLLILSLFRCVFLFMTVCLLVCLCMPLTADAVCAFFPFSAFVAISLSPDTSTSTYRSFFSSLLCLFA